MILTDIAKRSDTIDKVCSFAQGAALIKHDLYFFDVFSGPDRLVNQIGKTKNQNVLDRFFGQIMIYAKNLFFLKQFRQHRLEAFSTREIFAEGFFDQQTSPPRFVAT